MKLVPGAASNLSNQMNLQIVCNESFALPMYYRIIRVLLIVQIIKLCKPTLHGYDKLAHDQAHDILWPYTRAY